MRAFITVGSTKFDALIHQILSKNVLDSLREKGYTDVVIQYGNSQLANDLNPAFSDSAELESFGVQINIWRFKPSLREEYAGADLVISHAGGFYFDYHINQLRLVCIGAGTILDVLRLQKPLIAVPNATLLDNHQQELADTLSGLGYLVSSDIR
jgi:beta-1,4-N-acetylglucosaminyltransferase